MALPSEQAANLRAQTLEAAFALIDDLRHIREVVANQEPTAGDIRRLSAQLRRILVERDLAIVAAPRVGRVHLMSQNLKAVHVSNRHRPIQFFAAAGATIYGITLSALLIEEGSRPRDLDGYSPAALLALKLEGFLRQDVICLGGEWANRGDVIKYVANVAHGVHSGNLRDSVERLLNRVRHTSYVSLKDGVTQLVSDPSVFTTVVLPPLLSPTRIDYVLLELLAAASYLVNSPDVVALESLIATEVGL